MSSSSARSLQATLDHQRRIVVPVVRQGFAAGQRRVERKRLTPMGRRKRPPVTGTTLFHLHGTGNITAHGGKRVAPIFAVANDSARALGDRIHATDAVEHRADDEPTRVLGEPRTAQRIEGIHGANQADATVADEIVHVEARHDSLQATRGLRTRGSSVAHLLARAPNVGHCLRSSRGATKRGKPVPSSRRAISRASRSSS